MVRKIAYNMLGLVLELVFASLVSGAPQFRPFLPQLDGRIVGGETVAIEEFPYQVSILYYGSHICGGSIISNKYVITAGHCTDGDEKNVYSVRVGTSVKNFGGVLVPVAKVHQHPQFDLWAVDYDIAILELASNLTFGVGVDEVALPTQNETLPFGSESVVSGWGALTEGGSGSRLLQAVNVPIVDQETCLRYYGANAVTDRMFCAGVAEGQKDSCQGDSGGPLVANGKLYGIISWGYGCARPNMPGVYSSIPNLRQYIYEVTGL